MPTNYLCILADTLRLALMVGTVRILILGCN